jgi:hypothetical protein
VPAVRTGASPDDEHQIVFFRRHKDDDPKQPTPGREALDGYPTTVRAKMRAVLVAVATAPPKRFAQRTSGHDDVRASDRGTSVSAYP